MKAKLIDSDNIKKIVLTPESDNERGEIIGIKLDDSIVLSVDRSDEILVSLCNGGCIRWYDCDSLMLIRSPKKSEQFTIEDMKECFEQSRLTHSLAGFKHDTFENFMYWKKSIDSIK